MNWKYSAMEILAIGVFICFCIGMVSVMLGFMVTIASIFFVNTQIAEIGTSALFYGLAVIFICAGVGCFIPDKEKVLVK
jgi:hypothetical protein